MLLLLANCKNKNCCMTNKTVHTLKIAMFLCIAAIVRHVNFCGENVNLK